jgi:hypothetical protein
MSSWTTHKTVSYISGSSDSSDSESSDSDSDSKSGKDIQYPYVDTEKSAEQLQEELDLKDPKETIRALRESIRNLKRSNALLISTVSERDTSIRYYQSEMNYLHHKISISNGTPSTKRTSHRSSYACGVCKQRPKSTACVCETKQKRKKRKHL